MVSSMPTLRTLFALALLPVATACGSASSSASSSQDVTAGGACLPTLSCAAPALDPGAARPWRHPLKSRIDALAGKPHHRGRDLFLTPGAPQTILGKFAYGVEDKDLEDEDVDVYVQRDCASDWEKLGTAVTTGSGPAHATVEGVDDTGGRVYFTIPHDRALSAGKHRVRLVVAGDLSTTDLLLDVVPPGTPFFVSDVDGTLTSSENVEFKALLEGVLPETHPGAPEALRALVAKGYRPMYLTARPEWLVERTREFLAAHGFPEGLVHTSTSIAGAGFGSAAATFKQTELGMLAKKGLIPSFGFGNMPSDSDAYASAKVPEQHRIFFQISGAFTGRRIDSYNELLPDFDKLNPVCE